MTHIQPRRLRGGGGGGGLVCTYACMYVCMYVIYLLTLLTYRRTDIITYM